MGIGCPARVRSGKAQSGVQTYKNNQEEDQLHRNTGDQVSVHILVTFQQQALGENMGLTDDGYPHDELRHKNLDVVAEQKTVGIGGLDELRINRGKFVQKSVHPLAEMLITRSQQNEGHNEHEQSLDGVGVDHGIGPAEHHIAEDEYHDADEGPEFGYVQGTG